MAGVGRHALQGGHSLYRNFRHPVSSFTSSGVRRIDLVARVACFGGFGWLRMSLSIHDGAHPVIELGLHLLSHRIQAYHVISLVRSTLWFRYEDTPVQHGDLPT